MPQDVASPSVRLVTNVAAAPREAPAVGPLTAAGFQAAYREIASWPGYQPTPLVSLTGLARELGLGRLDYKDEGPRFGLGSFKPLGGAYAVARTLSRELARMGVAEDATAADLMAGRYARALKKVTIVTATDGNHGRAVAWGARRCGARAKVFAHDQMSAGRRAAIEALGADVIIVSGGYDDSVREAFRMAGANGWPVVQDTAIGDYRSVPIDICYGYGVIAQEVADALEEPPTHAIVQAGVGGVAAAICAQFWQRFGRRRPTFIVLEPTAADCVAKSLSAGRRVTLEGDTHTAMAGLACGEVSEVAWEVLATGADAALVASDDLAFFGMRRLAEPVAGDPPLVAGECAGGAIGALCAVMDTPDLSRALGLNAQSRVFVLGTEGATDAAIYQQIVGRPPEVIASASP